MGLLRPHMSVEPAADSVLGGASWHPDVVAVDIGVGARLVAEAELADEHEAAASAVAHGDAGVLREVLPAPAELARAFGVVKALLRDGQHVLGVRPCGGLGGRSSGMGRSKIPPKLSSNAEIGARNRAG